jgi:hypothetical protein
MKSILVLSLLLLGVTGHTSIVLAQSAGTFCRDRQPNHATDVAHGDLTH